jgi:hypothetical protein
LVRTGISTAGAIWEMFHFLRSEFNKSRSSMTKCQIARHNSVSSFGWEMGVPQRLDIMVECELPCGIVLGVATGL